MALLYVEKLFKSLSLEERKQLASELRQSRSTMLLTLHEILTQFERESKTLYRSKALAFKRLYGRAYSQKEDYLFRSECRALADKIEQFLARKAHQREFEQNRYRRELCLLEALLERRLWKEFKSRYEKSLRTALGACEFDVAFAIEQLYLKYLSQTSVPSVETLQTTRAVLGQSMRTLEDAFAAHYAGLKSRDIVASHYLQHYGIAADEFTPIYFERIVSPENALAQYFLAKAQAFRQLNCIQVDEAQRALETIMQVENDTPAFLYEKMAIITNVGLAYMLKADYAAAREYYAQAVAFCEQHALSINASLVLNLISVEMKLEHYDTALELLKTHWSGLAETKTTLLRAEVIYVFSLIFLERPVEAQRCIPKVDAYNSDFLRRYYRYAQIAIYYQAKNYDAALREAMSFAKYLRRHKTNPDTIYDIRLVSFYNRFLNTVYRTTSPKQPAVFAPLHKEFEAMIDNHILPNDTQPVTWLRRELRKLASD
ncbi:MAG: tetratricopeptide repeat protein [Candidatus Thermochlorobacter sp.]